MLTLVLLALAAVPLLVHFATSPPRFRSAPAILTGRPPNDGALDHTTVGQLRVPLFSRGMYLAKGYPDDRPPQRPIRLPFTSSDPLAKHRAVTGINAHVRWYQRLGSLVGVVILVVFMGVLLAVSVGVLFFASRIILELVVG